MHQHFNYSSLHRFVGKPADVYEFLEPLYNDYRKLRSRLVSGWEVSYMDELIDQLLTSEFAIGKAYLAFFPYLHSYCLLS
jgi:hypothetical protein